MPMGVPRVTPFSVPARGGKQRTDGGHAHTHSIQHAARPRPRPHESRRADRSRAAQKTRGGGGSARRRGPERICTASASLRPVEMAPAPAWPGRRRSSWIWISSSVSCMRGGTPSTMHPTPGLAGRAVYHQPASANLAHAPGAEHARRRPTAHGRRVARGGRAAARTQARVMRQRRLPTGAVALAERRDAEEGAKGRHAAARSLVLSLRAPLWMVAPPALNPANALGPPVLVREPHLHAIKYK